MNETLQISEIVSGQKGMSIKYVKIIPGNEYFLPLKPENSLITIAHVKISPGTERMCSSQGNI